eukprot:GHUV01009912.1.p1 GENE.GHUV01009912.1~~GHUV01009912.1.p1  ORF type:complete len:478 (+),score=131.75 GHUV01009912.1:2037-3470(+)
MTTLRGLSGVEVGSVLAYGYSFLVFGLQVNLLGPTASIQASRLGVTEADLGLIFTVNGLASIIGAVPSGWLVDKLPGHAVYAAAMIFQAVGFVLIPYTPTFAWLVACYGTVALSWNIVNTAGNTYILWIGNAADRPEAQAFLINMVNALFGAGSLAAPLMAELCASWLADAMSVYWITGALTAVSAVTFLTLPSPEPPNSNSSSMSPAPLLTADAHPEAGDAEAAVVSPALRVDEDNISSSSEELTTQLDDHYWTGGPLTVLLLVIALFNFLNVGTEVAFGGWIFTYAIKQAGLTPQEGHYLNASYWLAFTLGRVVASFAAVLMKPQTLLFASLPLAILGAAVCILAPSAWAGGWLLLVVTILVGLGVSAGFANALALLDSYYPCSGSVTGLLGGVAGAGCMVVPLIIALLAKHTTLQYQGLMWCSLVSFVVQLACVPLALLVGGWVQRSRNRWNDMQSVTKDILADEQQPLLEAEC